MAITAPIVAAVLVAASARADEPTPAEASADCSSHGLDAAPRVQRIGRLGVGGSALALAGVATTIGGGIVYARGTVVEGTRSSVLTNTNYRPLGGALIGVGVGAFALGMTALVVDVAVRAKKRRRTLAVAPQFAPRMTAVTVTARF